MPTSRIPSGVSSAGTALWASALAGGVAVLGVAVGRRWGPLMAVDAAVEQSTHGWVVDHRALLGAVGVITDLGSPVAMDVVVAIGVIVLLIARQVRAAIYLVAARLLELGIETLLKDTIARPRPVWIDPVASASNTSFPSGHSAGTAVVYLALMLIGARTVGRPRAGPGRRAADVGVVVGALLLVLVPISRVVLGVHYPSDVVAGVLLGLACALALSPLLPRSYRSPTRTTSGSHHDRAP